MAIITAESLTTSIYVKFSKCRTIVQASQGTAAEEEKNGKMWELTGSGGGLPKSHFFCNLTKCHHITLIEILVHTEDVIYKIHG